MLNVFKKFLFFTFILTSNAFLGFVFTPPSWGMIKNEENRNEENFPSSCPIKSSEISCHEKLLKTSKGWSYDNVICTGSIGKISFFYSDSKYQELLEEYTELLNISHPFSYDSPKEENDIPGFPRIISNPKKVMYIPQHCAYVTDDPEVYLTTSCVQNCVMLWGIVVSEDQQIIKRGGVHVDLTANLNSIARFLDDLNITGPSKVAYYLDSSYLSPTLRNLYDYLLAAGVKSKNIHVNPKNILGIPLFKEERNYIHPEKDYVDEEGHLLKKFHYTEEAQYIYTKDLTLSPDQDYGDLHTIKFISAAPALMSLAQSYWVVWKHYFFEDKVYDRDTGLSRINSPSLTHTISFKILTEQLFKKSPEALTLARSAPFQKLISLIDEGYERLLLRKKREEVGTKEEIIYLYEDIKKDGAIKEGKPFISPYATPITQIFYFKDKNPEILKYFSQKSLTNFVQQLEDYSIKEKEELLNLLLIHKIWENINEINWRHFNYISSAARPSIFKALEFFSLEGRVNPSNIEHFLLSLRHVGNGIDSGNIVKIESVIDLMIKLLTFKNFSGLNQSIKTILTSHYPNGQNEEARLQQILSQLDSLKD